MNNSTTEKLLNDIEQIKINLTNLEDTIKLLSLNNLEKNNSVVKKEKIIPRKIHTLKSSEIVYNQYNYINGYKIIKELDRGSSSIIYEASDDKTGKTVAIKKLKYGVTTFKKISINVQNEIDILMKLRSHPHIIQLLEYIIDNDNVYLIFNKCIGPIMKMTLKQQPAYSEHHLLKYARQILLAIEYLHSQGIIHRDIKPENVLVTYQDTIQLSDFGISQLKKDKINDNLGSRFYMAPELLSSKNNKVCINSNTSIDVWSYGICLYCLMVGKLPFYDINKMELIKKIKNCDYIVPDCLSQPFKDLLSKLIVINPKHRYTIEDIRKHNWITSNNTISLPTYDENCNFSIGKNVIIDISGSSMINKKSSNETLKPVSKNTGFFERVLKKTLLKNKSKSTSDLNKVTLEDSKKLNNLTRNHKNFTTPELMTNEFEIIQSDSQSNLNYKKKILFERNSCSKNLNSKCEIQSLHNKSQETIKQSLSYTDDSSNKSKRTYSNESDDLDSTYNKSNSIDNLYKQRKKLLKLYMNKKNQVS
jgi:serine/threonine protein kinase